MTRGSLSVPEHVEYLLHVAALLAACVELAVGVCARASLAEAVVRLRVYALRAAYLRQVFLAFAHVLAALHHHGAQSQLDELQRGKQSAGAGSHHHHLRLAAYVGIVRVSERLVCGHFVDVRAHAKVDVHLPLPRVDAALQYAQGVDVLPVDAFFL